MKNIVSKEIINLLFKSKDSDDTVIVYGIINYGLVGESISPSSVSKKWAEDHGSNFLEVRFKSIIDDTHKSMPIESFFRNYDLLTQKFDKTIWIN
jgi:hypothetical protein